VRCWHECQADVAADQHEINGCRDDECICHFVEDAVMHYAEFAHAIADVLSAVCRMAAAGGEDEAMEDAQSYASASELAATLPYDDE